MTNRLEGETQRNFFIFIDPSEPLINLHLKLTGCFASTPISENNENLAFIPNPNFQGGFISPFQNNLVRNYLVDYHLELKRRENFPNWPSRLQSIFLFDNEFDAKTYESFNIEHVASRQLQMVQTNGPYIYSTHDSTWINFLRQNASWDQETISFATECYWKGEASNSYNLTIYGKAWKREPIKEVLFLGRIDFNQAFLNQIRDRANT